MALTIEDIQNKLEGKFRDSVSNFRMEQDILTFDADSKEIKSLIQYMHEDEMLNFNFLTDLCGVHYPDNEKETEFCVVYLLHNWLENVIVRVKSYVSEANIEIDSVIDVFAAANWMERETFDFFGIRFKGHPNLKKILNDEGMTSFPLRKEYPLEDPERTDKDDRFFGRIPNNNQQTNY